MKFHLTQQQIKSLLKTVSILFLVIVLVRLIVVLLPPLILNVRLIDYPHSTNTVASNTQFIRITGLGLKSKSSNDRVFFDNKKIPDANVVEWSHTKIIFFIKDSVNKRALVHLAIQEKKSNRKIVLLVHSSNNRNMSEIIRAGDRFVENQPISPTITHSAIEEPYAPIVLEGATQGYCKDWKLQVDTTLITVPRYMIKTHKDEYLIYFDDSIWFPNIDSLQTTVLCYSKVHSFFVSLKNNADTSREYTRYTVLLRYVPAKRNVFLLPLQSKYQHVNVISTGIDYSYLDRATLFIQKPLSEISIEFVSQNRRYWSDKVNNLPVTYNDDPHFQHLFAQMLSIEQIEKVNAKIEELHGSTILLSEELQSSLRNSEIRNSLALHNSVESSAVDTDNANYKKVVRDINEYVETVLQSVNTLSIEDMRSFELLLNNTQLNFAENIDVLRNYLSAQLLRHAGLIARAIVGEMFVSSIHEKSKKSTISSRPTSWTEILVKEFGWVNTNPTEYNSIALYVAEEYFMHYNNKQHPLVPKIVLVSKEKK